MYFHKNSMKHHFIFGIGFLMVLISGCAEVEDRYISKSPFIEDSLQDGTTKATVDGGRFVEIGWQVGERGMLSYDLPGITQGSIEFQVAGLNRLTEDTTFLTMYEPRDWNYAKPYVTKNPYLAKVTVKKFENAPHSPFDFLWTIKNFPAATKPLERYIDGIPEGGEGYIEVVETQEYSIYLDQIYTIKVEWRFGKAMLYINGSLIAEHDYRPLIYDPETLRVVFGKTPAEEEFNIPGMVISNVRISFPNRQK